MSSSTKIEAGQEHIIAYPFSRDKYTSYDDDGPFTEVTWRPGCYAEETHDYVDYLADGMGKVSYRVMGVFKPESYPERVFYVRQWTDPDGRTFGKKKLHVTTTGNFRKILRGYRHDFELPEEE